MKRTFKILRLFQTVSINSETFSYSAVQHDIGAGDTVGGSQHAELELIAGKSERRSSVAVGSIAVEFREHIDAELHLRLLRFPVWGVVFNRLEYRIQFVSEKDGNHSGRRFIRSQPVIVSRGGYGNAQQILIIVHRLDDRT